jgi:outer membrane receptor protein involved in Fe transport
VLAPFADWTLRASYAATFRAPTLTQLFSPQSEGFFNSVPDPRRPVALTGDLYDGLNVSRLVRSGGNPALQAETGHVTQAGLVWAPLRGLWRGLSAEVNWFRYDLGNLISGVAPTYVLDNELGGLGHLVLRDPGTETYANTTGAPILVLTGPAGEKTPVAPGQSFTVPGRLQRIDSYIVNLSRRRLIGTDINLRYKRDMAALGHWTLGAAITCNIESSYAYDANSALADYTGTMSSPAWRGRGSLGWEKGAWQASATLQYTPASGDLLKEGGHFKPYRVVHLQLGYRTAPDSWLRGTSAYLGIDDVFEEELPLYNDPPIGYSYHRVARPQGRFWRVSLKRDW